MFGPVNKGSRLKLDGKQVGTQQRGRQPCRTTFLWVERGAWFRQSVKGQEPGAWLLACASSCRSAWGDCCECVGRGAAYKQRGSRFQAISAWCSPSFKYYCTPLYNFWEIIPYVEGHRVEYAPYVVLKSKSCKVVYYCTCETSKWDEWYSFATSLLP